MSYTPLFNEFETMLEALGLNGVDVSTEHRKLLRIGFMSGAHALTVVAAQGRMQTALGELEDFLTEIERGET